MPVTSKKDTSWGRFEQVSRDERYRIIGGSQGPGGSGKTHFWLTAPEPIAVMLFDPIGLEGLVSQPLFHDKDIRVIEYDFNPGKVKQDDRAQKATDALNQFLEDWQTALKLARTIIWDKEDHIWEMLRYARLEAVSGAPATYYELNLEYRGWFQDAANAGVNLGVIRGMKEKWGSRPNPKTGAMQGYATGEMEARGMKEVPELVQVYLDHKWEQERKAFITTIHEKCRIGNATEMIGTEHENLDFQTLAFLLYPETIDTPEVWL